MDMKPARTIGIDVGTSSLKLVALDEEGRIVARSSAGYGVETSAESHVTQRADLWWDALGKCLAEAGAQCCIAEARALALSCQGETLVCCDANGNALEPAISWLDNRATEEMNALAAEHSDWYERTGKPIGAYSTLSKILWLRKHRPEFVAGVARFCQVADYLVARLCGRWVLDVNNASFTSSFNVRQRAWDSEIVGRYGLEGKLPAVAESGTIAGPILPELARKWGLAEDLQVVLGGHDQGCAALGTGKSEEKTLILSTGTAWVLYCPMASPLLDREGRMVVYCHAQPGQWAALAAYSGGGALDAFLDRFWSGPRESAYAELLREENLADDLIVLPYFFGANSPENDPQAKAALVNWAPQHTAANVAMGFLEAIGFETLRNLELLRDMGIGVERVKMVGGACRSRIWPQLIADICGLPVEAMEQADAAPVGAAWLAGQALGLHGGAAPAFLWEAQHYAPRPDMQKRMAHKFARYMRAVEAERGRRETERKA